MTKFVPLFVIAIVVSVDGDTVRLADIQKAIHGLGMMMEKTWSLKSSEERKSIFELYTCLTLTKDLELLVFNRTEIFLEDERQTCTCRRVQGTLETTTNRIFLDSTFTTDLFIRMLISMITKYEDSHSLSQSFTHFNHEWLSSKKNDSHVHELRDVLVKLTPKENAIQILTRFAVKQWAIGVMADLNVPIFELYTCSSLLKQVEDFVDLRPGVMEQLQILEKAWYVPCVCHRMLELADSHCHSPKHCGPSFSIVHTPYEGKIYQLAKDMPFSTEFQYNL